MTNYGNYGGGYGQPNTYSQQGYGQPNQQQYGQMQANEADAWNDCELDEAKDYIILPDGDYSFRVIDWEKSRFGGSPKCEPCPITILHMLIPLGDGQEVTITENLFMNEKGKWRIAQLFKSIGAPVVNGKVQIQWSKLKGSSGMCSTKARTDDKGKTYNGIDKFLAPSR